MVQFSNDEARLKDKNLILKKYLNNWTLKQLKVRNYWFYSFQSILDSETSERLFFVNLTSSTFSSSHEQGVFISFFW